MASLGIQGSRFEVGEDNEFSFTCIELEVPMEPPPHGDHQQEPGYCNLELRIDDILTRFVSHQYKS